MASEIGKLRQIANKLAKQFTTRCRWSPGQSVWQGEKLEKQGPHLQGNFSSPGLSCMEITSEAIVVVRRVPDMAVKEFKKRRRRRRRKKKKV